MEAKLFLPFLMLMLSFNFGKSQVIKENAYVIEENGDTIKGKLEAANWKDTPQEMYFSSNEHPSDLIKLNTENISGFGYQNHHFIKTFIELNDMEIAIYADSFGIFIPHRIEVPKEKIFFVERIEEGKNLNLYEYVKNKVTRFVVGVPSRESSFIRFYTLGREVPWIYKNAQLAPLISFQVQLKLICKFSSLAGYTKLFDGINACSYSRKNLKKMIRKINQLKYSGKEAQRVLGAH